MKVVIYGTQYKAKRLCHHLRDDVEILAFTESGCVSSRKLWNGKFCLPLEDAIDLEYDYILIASSAYIEISTVLLTLGISEDKIVQPYNSHFMIPRTLFFFNRVDDSRKLDLFQDFQAFCCVRV